MAVMTASPIPRGREFTRADLDALPDDGNRYELRRREAMGPAELFLLDKVLRRLAEFEREQGSVDELTPAQDKRLRGMVHDTLRVLSPELAALGLCFADEMAILNWYGVQSRQGAEAAQAEPKNGDGA
mgnify:CR=1 FL=1